MVKRTAYTKNGICRWLNVSVPPETRLPSRSLGVLPAIFVKPCASDLLQVEFLGNFGPLRPMWSYSALTAGSVADITIVADDSSVYDSDGIGYVYHRSFFDV